MLSAPSHSAGWSSSTATQKQAQTVPEPSSSTGPVLQGSLQGASGGFVRTLHLMSEIASPPPFPGAWLGFQVSGSFSVLIVHMTGYGSAE